MDTAKLKKFAQAARRQLLNQVNTRLEQVLLPDSIARRESESAVRELERRIAATSTAAVIEEAAYTWFNRFCALRFMDVNNYTKIGTVTPLPGFTQPEILQEAKQGHISDEFSNFLNPQKVFDLLSGRLPSADPQQEAYRILLVAVCNRYNRLMPFMFEAIADFTELLLPDDLLSEGSVLNSIRDAIAVASGQGLGASENQTPATSHQPLATETIEVEIIGWLYQFYISEKKDEVFAGLKKNRKITPENIPAATQLFTPHWIVKYLVENSLGRLWMLNRPESKLAEKMEYYIRPDTSVGSEPSRSPLPTSHLRISSPEEIRILDPACGSGHMLTYAFDLLYAIYEEEGYETAQIPQKILANNLYGIEIDQRAGALAAFALFMKAREKSRRFFRHPVQPNICVLRKVSFEEGELAAVNDSGKWGVESEQRQALFHDLYLFEEADNFGSLLRPAMKVEDIEAVQKTVHFTLSTSHSLFEHATLTKVKVALEQASYLSPKYHVVIANPPYMGSKGMNGRLGSWAKENYPDSKSDLFAMFIERGFDFLVENGFSAMVTMQSWMFLSSYEKLRTKLLNGVTIECMAHMANMVMGIAFGTSATVWRKQYLDGYKGAFCYIEYEDIGEENKPTQFPPINERNKAAFRQQGGTK